MCRIPMLRYGTHVDLIGNFALQTENGIFTLTSTPKEKLQGIPCASLEEFKTAYEIMGNPEKARAIENYLAAGPKRFRASDKN